MDSKELNILIIHYKASEEDKVAFREAIKPIIDECSKEHGVSTDEIQSAKTAGSAETIKPCFLGCVFKKAEVVSTIPSWLFV